MAAIEFKFYSAILKQFFDKETFSVAKQILQSNKMNTQILIKNCESAEKVYSAFAELNKFGLLRTKSEFISINLNRLKTLILREKYVSVIEHSFNHKNAVILFEYLIKNGSVKESNLRKHFIDKAVNIKVKFDGIFDSQEIKNLMENDKICNTTKNLSEIPKINDFKKIIEKAINEGFVDKVIDDETIVKINHEKFEKELKKDYLTNFVAKETDIYSTCVVKAILELTAFPSLDDVEETPNFLPEKRKKSEKLEAANQQKIDAELIMKTITEDPKLNHLKLEFTKSKINSILFNLSNNRKVKILLNADFDSFAVDIEAIFNEMKRLYLQNSIKIKFGKHAARIFALLVQEKQLEDDQISDLALIPKEETRVLLYKMMNSGLVRLREIPIKPQEPSSNKIFYLWSVPTKLVFEAYKIEILYRNWIDLFERREKSVKKENGDSLNENSENLKEEETGFEEKLERLQKQIFLFEN